MKHRQQLAYFLCHRGLEVMREKKHQAFIAAHAVLSGIAAAVVRGTLVELHEQCMAVDRRPMRMGSPEYQFFTLPFREELRNHAAEIAIFNNHEKIAFREAQHFAALMRILARALATDLHINPGGSDFGPTLQHLVAICREHTTLQMIVRLPRNISQAKTD